MSTTRRSVSVCMATYQGAEYVAEQIESILPQLCGGDELVVSEDGSTDGTREIVAQYARGGAPLRLIDGPRQGLVANFQNAVSNASGEVLFLADQDDVWLPGKVERMLAEFDDPGCLVAVHDAALVDAEGKPLGQTAFALRHSGSGLMKNFVKNSYVGCCMAVRASFRDAFLPIPNVAYHDWWIGMLSDMQHGSRFVPEVLLEYRRHGDNASPSSHYPLGKMVSMRAQYASALARRRRELGW